MDYAERLGQVAVLGAAGKMGSGIVLLLAQEMADLGLQPEHRGQSFVLHAVDVSHRALSGLLAYVRDQTRKAAEKRIVALRAAYADRLDLVDNSDIVEQYVRDVVDLIRPAATLTAAEGSHVVFEAMPEDLALKVATLARVAAGAGAEAWVFSNTSSIPIEELDEQAGLDGRVMGVHFYNPPAVQRLVELIRSRVTRSEVAEFAETLARRLRKTVVRSRDRAGFIGNGHFMRDVLSAMHEAERLAADTTWAEAVYAVNRVSQDFLVRPMGIFQVIDYVGLDVCHAILGIMNARLEGQGLHSPQIDRLLEQGVRGGQRHDGSQKDGFLRYEQGQPVGVYDPDARRYVPVTDIQLACDAMLGGLPDPPLPWKTAMRHPERDRALSAFFASLRAMQTPGAQMAVRLGRRSRDIGLQLVADGVAASPDDVNAVLLTGFYHVYGPINDDFL